jgi:transcription elongation factor Elf1
MIFLSTGDVPCPHCGVKTAMGLLEIRDMKMFVCPGCAQESSIDVTKYSHDIAMYEWARRQFAGHQDVDE